MFPVPVVLFDCEFQKSILVRTLKKTEERLILNNELYKQVKFNLIKSNL